jgi:maltodextrin utilization protein YvdJ
MGLINHHFIFILVVLTTLLLVPVPVTLGNEDNFDNSQLILINTINSAAGMEIIPKGTKFKVKSKEFNWKNSQISGKIKEILEKIRKFSHKIEKIWEIEKNFKICPI